jgi:hypothetical protein
MICLHRLDATTLITRATLLTAAGLFAAGGAALAQGDAAELAKKLSNPVAAMISLPLQLNPDVNLGPDDAGERLTLNIQPVIPASISPKWNLISRIITPIVFVDDLSPTSGSAFGLGDMTPTFFFSPKEPTSGGLIWGAGPVLLLPTATDDLLGADQWGAGPSFLALTQKNGWTVGALANHVEHVAGDDRLAKVSTSFVQPFLSRSYPSSLTIGVNTESTYDWNEGQWTVPVNLSLTTVSKWGSQLVQVGGGLRYYLEAPEGGPEWGVRLSLTYLWPK